MHKRRKRHGRKAALQGLEPPVCPVPNPGKEAEKNLRGKGK
jgi:hypothetical protein